MRAIEGFTIQNQGAGSYPIKPGNGNVAALLGGRYLFAAIGTWGGGNIKLQVLGPDGSTYLDIYGQYDASAAEQNEPINTITVNSAMTLDLAPGVYKFLITTATAVYASLTRVPLSE